MGYANHIGRVGALAVALGVGVAVANSPGVAWATTDGDSPSASSGSTDASGAKNPAKAPAEPSAPPVSSTTNQGAGTITTKKSLRDTILAGPHVIVRSSGGAVNSTDDTHTGPGALPKLKDLVPAFRSNKPSNPIASFDPQSHVPDINDVEPQHLSAPSDGPQQLVKPNSAPEVPSRVLTAVTAPLARLSAQQAGQLTPDTGTMTFTTLSTPGPLVAPAALAPVTTPTTPSSLLGIPASLINGVVNLAVSLFQPVVGPGAPFDNPTLWGVLAWTRRQTAKTFANQTPTLNPQQTSQDLDDLQVHGTFVPAGVPADPDGDTVTYTVPDEGEVGGPAHGVVTIDQAAHTWTYTPDAGSTADDSFTVTASDAASGFHIHAPGQSHTATAVVDVHVAAPGPVITPHDDGTVDLALDYGSPGEFSNVEIPVAGQPGAPKYWIVKSQQYDPATGKLVAVLEPTGRAIARGSASADQ